MAVMGRSSALTRFRETPPLAVSGVAGKSVKCVPEPREEEMPPRIGRVKAGPVICRRVISESGTAY